MEGTQVAFLVFSVCTFVMVGIFWYGLRRREKISDNRKD